MLFRAYLLRLPTVHQCWSHSLSRTCRAFSAPNQYFTLPVRSSHQIMTSPNLAFAIFPNILTNTLARALSFHFHVLDASFTPQTSILVGLSTPLRSVFRFLSFLVHNSQLFFRLRLKLITVLPIFHQAVKAGCILQSCIHLCSLLLDCLCSSVKCLKPSIMLFLLLSQRPATIL